METTAPLNNAAVSLDSVLTTDELIRRPTRPPDYRAESGALGELAEALADSPRTILQKLVEVAVNICRAGSAGISLLSKENGNDTFYWPAIAGAWRPHVGGGTPRHFGPCGVVLDRDAVQLFRRPERFYAYLVPVSPPIEEALLTPFYVGGKAVGTVWVIAHDERRRFDAEDSRLIVSLGKFASSAYQVLESLDALERQDKVLRQSEERFRSLAVATAQIVWTTDANGQVSEDSPSWRAFTGQTFERWKGWGWLDAIHPDDRERTAQIWRRCVSDKSICQTAYRLRTANGSYRWTAVRAVPVLEADGRVREWIGTNTDITELRGSEDALRESEQRFRTLADHAPVLIWIIGSTGCEFVNRSYLEFLGVSMEDAQRMGWAKYVHPDDCEKYIGGFLAASEKRVIFEGEVRFRRSDGVYRAMKTAALPRFSEAGDFLGYVGCSFDITDVKEIDRRKTEFLAMLAHELRNPLAAIGNASQLLQRTGGDSQEIRSTTEMLERQVAQMVRLIDDLLDVNRISRGKIELRKERIELAMVVNHATETVRSFCESMDHDLVVTLPVQPLYLIADPTRLTQVVGNLLNNAYKFTERGGRIRLTVERQRGQAEIRIQDDGIGIPEDQIPRIFEMFTQLDPPERSLGGLGIGLTLVRNLVEMHGGTVDARSAGVGQGSEFVVRLPILDEPPSPPPQVPSASEPKPSIHRRILVVDDNRDSADGLAMLLKLSGHEVHTAYDGVEAIEAAAKFRPQVILLDIGLPRLNGYEAARRIREQQWGDHTVLVALTGWGQEEDRRSSAEAGFNAHLVKPVEYAALTELLAGFAVR